MKINTSTISTKQTNLQKQQSFKNGLMSPLSKTLYTLSNNDMLNAAAIDITAMDTPRTVVEFKERGKNAGIEMFFREYTGTFIAEFSAALFARGISKVVSKAYKPDIKVNPNSWVTNNALNTFTEIYKSSDKTPVGFIKDTLNSMQGLAGKENKNFLSASEEKAKPIIDGLTELITNKSLTKSQSKELTENVKDKIIEVLGADNQIKISSQNNELTSNLSHTLRDITDLGKNVFFAENQSNIDKVVSKLKTMNKSRILFAIPASMILAITNQYINRQLTKKRTGIDNFVGENNYERNVKNKAQKENQKGLFAKKVLSAGVFLAMLTKVMGIQKPSDFVNKLEFDGPATGGNAIKTIYGTLILGRIFASKDSTELRETDVRDYLGFLNWLVLGGFVAKGVGQMLDPKQEQLFNVAKQGKGVAHWLKDVSLKSQKEIIAQGGNVAKNLRKLNIAQLSGIAYSAVMLGVLLPKLNIAMTKRSGKKKELDNNFNFLSQYTFDKFEKDIKK
jgi:hypothetical protein